MSGSLSLEQEKRKEKGRCEGSKAYTLSKAEVGSPPCPATHLGTFFLSPIYSVYLLQFLALFIKTIFNEFFFSSRILTILLLPNKKRTISYISKYIVITQTRRTMVVGTSLEETIRSKLDSELLFICESDQPYALENVLQQRATTTPNYIPPLSTIMAAAVYHDSSAIVAYCLSRKAKMVDPTMTFIAQRGAWKSYQLIIEAGAIDINYVVPWYGDILSTVATNDNLEMARFCLEHGADPNQNRVDEHKTVIAATAELGYVDMVALLLEYGAVLQGSGAIILAAEEGEVEMVRFLLKMGADVDEVGVEDPLDERTKEDVGSALHHAIENAHLEVVQLLIESGADVELANAQGLNARRLAEKGGLIEVVEMIRGRP